MFVLPTYFLNVILETKCSYYYIYILISKNPEKERMIARILESEKDIKEGRVLTFEEAEKRLGLA